MPAPVLVTCVSFVKAEKTCDYECGFGVCSEATNGVKSCNCYSGFKKLPGNLDECKSEFIFIFSVV